MNKAPVTSDMSELRNRVARIEPWRPWVEYTEEEITELLTLVEDAARILTKGVTTRSESDPLSRLLVRIAQGDCAKKTILELEEAQVVIVAELRKELSEIRTGYREDVADLVKAHNEIVASYERQLAELRRE